MPARYISLQDAAERCGVTERTVRNWVAKGIITGYRMPAGKIVRVDPEEISALIEPIPTGWGGPGTYTPAAKGARSVR